MTLFSDKTYKIRQEKVKTAVSSLLDSDELLVVHAGYPLQKPGGLDQTYDFIPHPLYFWLTGHRRPEGIFVFSKNQVHGEFQRNLSSTEIVWEGEQWNFHCNQSLKDFESLKSQFQKQIDLGSNQSSNPRDLSEKAFALHVLIDQVRRKKDSEEVLLIKSLAQMAAVGYQEVAASLVPGLSERAIQLIYENAVLRAGAEKMPYGSIVGSGENAAILHAVPSSKKVQKNEMVLIDAGADLQDYCVDITRMFPVSGRWTSQQQEIYDIVLTAQLLAIDHCRVGHHWRDVHLISAEVIAQGLSDLGIFKSDLESVLESGAISVFYPHGVGHLVGLKVRDTGMIENRNPQKYAGSNLRVDLQLEEDFCLTVEPGCYFSRAFIEDPQIREKYKDHINWSEAEKWMTFGGVRLEDDVLITKKQPEILTQAVPK